MSQLYFRTGLNLSQSHDSTESSGSAVFQVICWFESTKSCFLGFSVCWQAEASLLIQLNHLSQLCFWESINARQSPDLSESSEFTVSIVSTYLGQWTKLESANLPCVLWSHQDDCLRSIDCTSISRISIMDVYIGLPNLWFDSGIKYSPVKSTHPTITGLREVLRMWIFN